MEFPFENLEAYNQFIQFVTLIESLLDSNKSQVTRSLADQIFRTVLSIPLNFSEGNGRWHRAEKRQFFWFARGSVFE
jgi:four helix bundle protein